MSTIRQRGTAAVLLLLHCICSVSVYRASTGSTQFPTVELVDPEGCSQGVKSHNLHSPLHRDNLLSTPLRISPVQILTHLDNRDHRLGREECRLILSIRRHRNHPLAYRHTLHIKPLRWQHQDRSIPTYLHRSLALTGPVPPVKVLCPVVATRLIQRPAHHPAARLCPLLTNY
jgi:hypothetical protein